MNGFPQIRNSYQCLLVLGTLMFFQLTITNGNCINAKIIITYYESYDYYYEIYIQLKIIHECYIKF